MRLFDSRSASMIISGYSLGWHRDQHGYQHSLIVLEK